jgi:hypothetical protein
LTSLIVGLSFDYSTIFDGGATGAGFTSFDTLLPFNYLGASLMILVDCSFGMGMSSSS